ncbi:hypothetical protein LCGC14_0529120 [marine sediment metagenome]|uniref:Uncharacterized protein n=1 Tax=marine sediment metagenome TaxID=412755 RepID=A0A0F9V481_9ZZZZ
MTNRIVISLTPLQVATLIEAVSDYALSHNLTVPPARKRRAAWGAARHMEKALAKFREV